MFLNKTSNKQNFGAAAEVYSIRCTISKDDKLSHAWAQHWWDLSVTVYASSLWPPA